MKTISQYQWKRYNQLGVAHVTKAGQACVMEWIPGSGTCLTPVTVTADGFPVKS